MKRSIILIIIAGCFSVSGCASPQQQYEDILAKGPEHFYNTATIDDDALDVVVTITTYEGYQQKNGLLGIVWFDNFLRGFVDKKTGETTVQLYQMINYSGYDWRFYESVNCETESGPQAGDVTAISRDVYSGYEDLTYSESLGVELKESFLRDVVERYRKENKDVWQFQFNARSGHEHKDFMMINEIEGFLKALDQYRENHPKENN